MFGLKPKKNELDPTIEVLLREMATTPPDTKKYDDLLSRVEKLYKLRAMDRPERVSRDTLVLAGANLAGLLVIVAYEQKHIFGKAINFVFKPKLD